MHDIVNGLRVHGRASARRPGVPIVFVHGLGMSVRYMEPTMVHLAGRHYVEGLDLPGFGESGDPDHALTLRELADALAAWLDVRGIARCVLVGNSYGCQVIVDLAQRAPQRVAAIVLNAPTMDPAHRSVIQQVGRVLLDIPREPWSLAPVVIVAYLRAGPFRLLATLRHALADRIEEKLPDLIAPVLVVTGAHDPVVTVRWAGEAARLVGTACNGAGGTLHVAPHAAHALPFDDPVTFGALIEQFLASALADTDAADVS